PTSGIVLTQEFLLLRAHLVGEVLVEFAQCAPVLAHPTIDPLGDATRCQGTAGTVDPVNGVPADDDPDGQVEQTSDHRLAPFRLRVRTRGRVRRWPTTSRTT